MVPFLVAFGVIGFLVACSVGVSLYLFQCGVVGRNFRRSPRLHQIAVGAAHADSDDDGFMIEADIDGTSRFARSSIVFMCGGVVVLAIVLTTLLNAVIH